MASASTTDAESHDDKGKPFKARAKKAYPQIKFRPNEYKAVIQTVTDRSPKQYHEFTHDTTGITLFMIDMAPSIESTSHSGFNSQPQPAVITESLIRMGHFVVGKKLAHAMDESNRAIYSDDLKPLLKAELFVPDIVQRVADGYGTFAVSGAHWRPDNLPFHAYSHFVKGVHIAGQDGVPVPINEDDMFINTRFADWKGMAITYYRGKYTRWAENTRQFQVVVIGGLNVRMKPPIASSGFAGLGAVLIAAGFEIPLDIMNSMAIMEGFEGLGNNAPTQPVIDAMRGHGLVLIDWTYPVTKAHVANYLLRWEASVSQLLASTFRCSTGVRTMDTTGKAWQVMDSTGFERSEHPFELGDGDREIGYMLEQRVYHKFDPHQMWTQSDTSPAEARIRFIRENARESTSKAV